MNNNFKLYIADTIISLIGEDGVRLIKKNSPYGLFRTEGKPEVNLRFHHDSYFKRERNISEEIIFDSFPSWKLFYSEGKYIFETRARTMVITPDFTSGEVYVDKNRGLQPFSYPLDEVLMINLLGKGRGILVHGCGVKNDNDEGLLFAGTSRAGKSTMANLWKRRNRSIGNSRHSAARDTTILSDDRIIIRKMESQFWIYGTPWHGDAKVCSPEKFPLKKVFFLKHAPENFVRNLKKAEAASKLLVRSFAPFWDKKGMEFTLRFIEELTARVPCYDLSFYPDKRAIDFVESI
jgi:hypothetical protein